MELQECARGDRVRLHRIAADREQRRRLLEFGFVPGCVIQVVGRNAAGGLVLALGDARIAVDAEVCRTLRVGPTTAGS